MHAAAPAQAGFTLIELLVAIFVLAMAVAGAVAVVYSAGRNSTAARERCAAAELARCALADVETAACLYRENNGGALNFGAPPFDMPPYSQRAADALGPAGCQRAGYRKRGAADDRTYGWLWRAHSFDAATGLYSADIWVFRDPEEIYVQWGLAPDSALKSRCTLFYLRTRLGTRGP
jgi:prepilin-type N-terminal cleavage/methylation domain-containing protein